MMQGFDTMSHMNKTTLHGKRVLLTGGAGFLGQFVKRELMEHGVKAKDIFIPRSRQYDLRKESVCAKVMKNIDIVIHLAATVGGIEYNRQNPGTIFYDNLSMGLHLIEAARKAKVEKFVSIGTVCSYPKITEVPFKEEDLWKGYPEETNAPYGLAKKMMLVQAQSYRTQFGFNTICLLPVNLYGPGDDFNPETSHVIPAIIKKFADAKKAKQKTVSIWGTGKATREFLYVEDAAEGIVLATEKYDGNEPINLGSCFEISIFDLAHLVAKLVGYKGEILFDSTKPDGQPRRKLDVSRAEKEFNFKSKTSFEKGLKKTIKWYLDKQK